MKVFAAFALALACGAAIGAQTSAPLAVTVTVIRPAPVVVVAAADSAQQVPSAQARPDVSVRTRDDIRYLIVEY
jgi:hypothetical protein